MTLDLLAGKQNPDGGWPYVRGASWTEPTVYSVMAMLANGETARAARGVRWITRAQRSDGGFAPQSGIEESSWVTALVALLPPEKLGPEVHRRAVRWLLRTTGEESTAVYRLRQWLLGNGRPADQKFPGWPWLPGTAAWVGPTALAILALDKQGRREASAEIRDRVSQGRQFLLTRMCPEGGWNHGSAQALGYASHAYPETTGMALAALRGVRNPQLQQAIGKARDFLNESHSADAINWLRVGLLAQGELPSHYHPPDGVECRTLPETSLDLLWDGFEKGSNPFWA